jgi:hypothetical protein
MAEPPSVGYGENNNQLLEKENLAFIGCSVVGAAVVDDVEVVEVGELLSTMT